MVGPSLSQVKEKRAGWYLPSPGSPQLTQHPMVSPNPKTALLKPQGELSWMETRGL